MILLYIDPGTGAMLFSILMAVVTTGMYFLKGAWIKIKYRIGSGKEDTVSNETYSFVIYSDHKRYWNVFGPICDEFERRKLPCQFWTMSPDDPALSKAYEYVKCEFIGEGNKAFAKLNMMNADICLSTTPGLDVYQWKRSPFVKKYVHIFHNVGGSTGYRMFGIDYYDALLIAGPSVEYYLRKLEEMRNLPAKDIVVVGNPYMDTLLEKHQLAKQTANEVPTILLAPSWGASSILNKYGENFLKQLQATGYHIIVRPHPQMKISDADLLKKLQKLFPESDSFQWNFDNDNFGVLEKADLMISDFSGVICDFAYVLNKPIIYANAEYNPAPYDAAWFDEPLWMDKTLPQIGKPLQENEFPQLKEIITDMLTNENFKITREKASHEDWQFRGESAMQTVDYLVKMYSNLPKS